MASTFLSRTPSVAGDRRTHTFSFWYKRTGISDQYAHFYTTSVDLLGLVNDYLFFNFNGNVSGGYSFANNLLRDPSAWYHIVCAIDTTNATANDRLKLYLNGERLTPSYINNPSQNYESGINNTQIQVIGKRQSNNDRFLNGILAHYHFIDGTAYDASAFGETDSTTGIWRPKTSPSVTYGTNGFFLKFASSGSMGTDSSGNGNNFTVGAGNLTQTQDTPSNVFCTLNPLSVATNHTLTNANLTSTNSSSSQGGVNGTLNYPTSGKWYHEVKINAEDSSKGQGVGIGDNVYRSDWGTYSNFVGYLSDGTITAQGDAGYTSYGTAQNVGDIIGVAYNADDQELTFYLNGTSQGAISTSSMDGTIDFDNLCPLAFGRNMGQSFNFGNGYFGTTAVSSANSDGGGIGLFEYEVPSGYYALCTKNINTYG